jgi:Transglycosylase SLT domain
MTLSARLSTLLCLAILGAGTAANAHESALPWDACRDAVAKVNADGKVPEHLLIAIAQVESGRWNEVAEEKIAWPWTVTAKGHGRYLPSKAAALAEIKSLQARGISNIDVGCMQINLRYHPKAFEDMEAALDPGRNVAYAAKLLSSLRRDRGSWTRAVGNYHSNKPTRTGPYRVKVFRALFAERRRATKARRAASQQAKF